MAEPWYGVVYAAEGTPTGVLAEIAGAFSPRIEAGTPPAREVVLDLSGLTRMFGTPRAMAEELRRAAADRGVRVRVVVARTSTAARLLVRHRAGIAVIAPGTEAETLSPLPLQLLGMLCDSNGPNVLNAPNIPNVLNAPNVPNASNDPNVPNVLNAPNNPNAPNVPNVLFRWGLRTLGDLAALPADGLAARLGASAPQWQRLARGEDLCPLVPAVADVPFEQALDLDWPIDELEPLSFVLGRLLEPLAVRLEREGRGAAVLRVRLHLVDVGGAAARVHERALELPTPIREARTLRTLALLDLESHPPDAPVDRVMVAIDPTPGRVVQYSLLARPLPAPEQIATLLARLQALMGERRCGAPALTDSWQPGAVAMARFAPADVEPEADPRPGADLRPVPAAVRRFRHPVPVRVIVQHGKPASVLTTRRGMAGGEVEACAGPWRTSGGWWTAEDTAAPAGAWDRDEWEVALGGGTAMYRLFRDRGTNQWFLDGIVD